MSRDRKIPTRQSAQDNLQRDIREFVRVMATYPELVSLEPNLSFQEYCARFYANDTTADS
jgi:hypothetical protein